MKYLKKIIEILFNIINFGLIFIIVVVLYNLIQIKVLDRPYTSFLGYTTFEVGSGSMEPTISEKDLVIVKLGADIKNNDIVTYESNTIYITHRVLNIQGDYIITKGDANNTNDKPINKTSVIGKVVKIIPNFGIWRAVLTTPKVMISVIITCILFVIGFSCGKKQLKKCIDFAISRKDIIEEFEDEEDEKKN